MRKRPSKKGYEIAKKLDLVCEWCGLYKTDVSFIWLLPEMFPYLFCLSEEQLLQRCIDGRLFGYVQLDMDVPEHLRH